MSITVNNIISPNIVALEKTIDEMRREIIHIKNLQQGKNRTGIRVNKKFNFKITNPLLSSVGVGSYSNLTTNSWYPSVYNQGNLGSCTANGAAFCYQFDLLKKNPNNTFIPSRLFIYYCERVLGWYQFPSENFLTNQTTIDQNNGTIVLPDSTEIIPSNAPLPLSSFPPVIGDDTTQSLNFPINDSDTGSQVYLGIFSINLYGVCSDSVWPYTDDNNVYKNFPTNKLSTIISECSNNIGKKFYPVGGLDLEEDFGDIPSNAKNDLVSIKTSLNNGYPVIFGMSLTNQIYSNLSNYPYYENTSPPSPQIIDKINEDNSGFAGGHCVVIVGHSDELGAFLIRNSWGNNWGYNGHFYLSYNYVQDPNCTTDFWVLSEIGTDPNLKYGY